MADTVEVIIKGTDQLSKAVGEASASLAGLGKTAGILAGVGLAGAVAAGGVLVGILADLTGAAAAAEPATAKLEAILRNTGIASGVTAEQAKTLAEKFQGLTTFSDTATLAGQTVLAVFSDIGTNVFPAATGAMLDLATKMGTDTPRAAELLARAMGGDPFSLKALQREIGPFTTAQLKMIAGFKETGDKAGLQNVVLEAVKGKIGGLAEAMGNTATGQMTIFSNTLEGIKVKLGTPMLKPLTDLARVLNEQLAKPEVQAALTATAEALGKLASTVLPALAGLLPAVAVGMTVIANAVTLIANAITTGDWKPVTDALTATATGWGTAMWEGITGSFKPTPERNAAMAAVLSNEDLKAQMTAQARLSGQAAAQGMSDGLAGWLEADLTGKARVLAWGQSVGTEGVIAGLSTAISAAGSVVSDAIMRLVFGPGGILGFQIAITWGTAVAGGFVSGMWDTVTKLWKDVDFASLGQGIIDGVVKGITDNASKVASAISGAVNDAIAAAKGVLGIQSPSRVFAEIGRNVGQGLANGITAAVPGTRGAAAMMINAVIQAVDDGIAEGPSPAQMWAAKWPADLMRASIEPMRKVGIAWVDAILSGMSNQTTGITSGTKTALEGTFRQWWTALKTTFGNPGSGVRRQFQDWMGDWMTIASQGAGETLGSVASRMLDTAVRTAGPNIARIVTANRGLFLSLMGSGVSQTSGGMFAGFDKIMSLAGTLGGLGGAAASRYQAQVLDPARAHLQVLEDQLATMQEQNVSQTRQAAIVKQIAAQKKEIAASEKMLTSLAKQQADLQFIQAQADLIKMIKENGLDAKKILGGLKLGLGADLSAVIAAMTAAMRQMVRAAQRELGVASPSRVFAQIGEQVMAGFGGGVLRAAPAAAGMVGMGMRSVVTQNTYHYNLSANYKYESQASVVDRIKVLRMLTG